MKNFLVVSCIVALSSVAPVFAVETIMTPEAKQQALDSLASYEQQQITQLSVQSDQAPTNSVQCVGESCVGVQQPAQSDEVYEEGKPAVHRVSLYFLNDSSILEGYQHRGEDFFNMKGVELKLFKEATLHHYLGNNSKKIKAKLLVTQPKYVGIRAYMTQDELKVLLESDTRITSIKHKGNSGLVMSR